MNKNCPCYDPKISNPPQLRTIAWNDVRIELPDDYVMVLIQFDTASKPEVCIGFYMGDTAVAKTGWVDCDLNECEVTHWADLPEPAKQQEIQ